MNEIDLLRSRIDDTITDAYEKGFGFLGFLNEAEISFAKGYLKNLGVSFSFYGGYPLSSRCYLCISPYEEIKTSSYPFSPYLIKARDSAILSHRDYLGSIMALGIKRDCLGDILTIEPNSAIVFIRNEVADYIKDQLYTVGREKVKISEYAEHIENYEPKSEELRIIVSSMRADNVVSACINKSRTSATELIGAEQVYLNYITVTKVSQSISEGDILSIRGYGKFQIMEQVSSTRKDRLVIRVLHYI